MLCSCQNGVSGKLSLWMPAILLVLASLPGNCLQAKADEKEVAPARTSVVWVPGPTNIILGEIAIEVMNGYKFTDAAGAQAILSPRNPLPRGLIGFLVSSAETLGVVLAVDQIGYVKDETIDPAAYAQVLKKAQTQNGIAKAEWQIQPEKGPRPHSVHWEIKAQTKANETTLNYTVQLLGRQSLLTMTAFFSGATGPEDLLPLISRVGFRRGEQYSDYKEGRDKLANMTLAQAAARYAESELETAAAPPSSSTQIARWGGLALIVALGIAALVVAVGKLAGAVKKLRPQEIEAMSPAVEPDTVAETLANGNGHDSPKSTVHNGAQVKNGTHSGRKTRNGRLIKVNGHKGRRREFDYNKYFADLMSTVSSHGISLETTPAAHFPATTIPVTEMDSNGHVVEPYTANSEILARQSNLIEEQRRLIQEQAKLIEEKSQLISEKNALLQIQRELIDQKMI